MAFLHNSLDFHLWGHLNVNSIQTVNKQQILGRGNICVCVRISKKRIAELLFSDRVKVFNLLMSTKYNKGL